MALYRVKQTITYVMEVEADTAREAVQDFSTDECDELVEGRVVVAKIED